MNYSVDFRHIYHINDTCAMSISFTANFLLLFLIIKKTTPEMSVYKKILLQNCVVDTLLAFAVAIAEPIVVFKDGNEYIINNGILRRFSSQVDFFVLTNWIFALVFSYCSLSVQFLYRYVSLVKNYKLTGLKFASLFIIPVLVNTIHVIICAVLFYPTEEKLKVAVEHLAIYFKEDDAQRISIGWVGFSSRPDTWVVAFDMSVLTAGSYALAIWCNIKIWWHLKEKMQLVTQATRDMHSQINKTLIAQAIGPLAVNVLPMLMFMYCIISEADAIILSAWTGLPLAWIPVVNPILTIWFVKPYRMALCPIRSSMVHSEATYGMFSADIQ